MERDLKGLIDSIDQKDKTESMLERKIDSLKEEINRLRFTIREQKLLIQSLKEKKNDDDEALDDDIQLLKDMIFSQRQEILKKDEQIQELRQEKENLDMLIPISEDSSLYMEEIDNLNKSIQALNNQLELYKTNEENAKKLIEELTRQDKASKEELEELLSYIKKLEEEKIEETSGQNDNSENNTEIESYKAQIIDLQKSLMSLEEASKINREKSNDIIDQLSQENDDYKEEIDSLKEKIEGIENKELKNEIISNIDDYYELEKHYENQMTRLESENKAFQVELESLRTQIRDLKKSELESDSEQKLYDVESTEIIKTLKQENDVLKESISTLNIENKELHEKLLITEEKNGESLKFPKDNEVSLIVRELKEENQQLLIKNRDLKTRLSVFLSDEAESKQTIEALKNKIQRLRTKLEVEILEKEYEMPVESESELYKKFLKNLDQERMQLSIDNLVKNIKSNKSYEVKKNSLNFLATLTDERIKKFFTELVMDRDWLIRFHLIKAIEKTRNIEYKDLLIKLTNDKDVDVREAAKDVLSKL